MNPEKNVLLVGAMGGLGAATTKHLSFNGYHVYAADIRHEVFRAYDQYDKITPIQIDITSIDSIMEVYTQIASQTKGLCAVINMAGIIKIGSLVELPVSDLEEVLAINLLGIYNVNKIFLPLLQQGKGRIINLSSEVVRQTAAPFNGIYSISKYALEAYSDALRRELSYLDIKVIKIQPGPFKTEMTKNAEQLFGDAHRDSIMFKKNLATGITYLPKVYKNSHDPSYVAKTILKALKSSNPKTAYLIKPDILRMILDLLPVKWADKLLKRVLS